MDSAIRLERKGSPSFLTTRSISSILELKIVSSREALAVSDLLKSQDPRYVKFFTPFEYDTCSIMNLLNGVKNDIYLGMYSETALVGLAMLRGWDEDFEIPAIGLMVDQRYKGRGFASAALYTLLGIARAKFCRVAMAKVYPENIRSYNFFLRHGFMLSRKSEDKYIFIKSLGSDNVSRS